MAKLFYDHLIIKEELIADIDLHELDSESREELVDLIDQIINHQVLNVIFSHLPKEHHADFVKRLTTNPDDAELISFVSTHSKVDIESELKKHLSKLKAELKSEIKKSSSKRK